MSETKKSIDSLFEALMNAQLPTIKTSVGKDTFGVVNSAQNGKRLSISKALAQHLGVDTFVYAMPSAEERKLVLGKELPFTNAVELKLSGEGKKLCYNAHIVELLTDMFSLDFSTHVSMTVSNIVLDVKNGVPVAVVNFP